MDWFSGGGAVSLAPLPHPSDAFLEELIALLAELVCLSLNHPSMA